MADERGNRLVSALNTDNVKNGLFEYQGKSDVKAIQSVGGGFQNLVSNGNTSASDLYKQASDLMSGSLKVYTAKNEQENDANELKQFINAGQELSVAYQTFQNEKEALTTAEEKQIRIDQFRDDVSGWSDKLSDKNKNSILSTTHNYLTFEVREQANLVKKENVDNINKSLSATASTLLSMNDTEMFDTINNFKATAKSVGVSENDFNEMAFKQLNTNLLLGINKKNISREALDIIESKAYVLSENLYGVKETNAYKTSMNTIENLREGLNSRDKAIISRSIQVGDIDSFNVYNDDLHNKGVLNDIEHNQNRLYYKQTRKVERESTAGSVKALESMSKESLGFDINEVPYDLIKDLPQLSTKQKTYIKNQRALEVKTTLLNGELDLNKARTQLQRDPNIFAQGFKEYAVTVNDRLRSIIGSGGLKDTSSPDYTSNVQAIAQEISKANVFMDNPNFSIHLTDKAKEEMDFIRNTRDILNDSFIGDKQKALSNMYSDIKLDDTQKKNIKDMTEILKKEIPVDSYTDNYNNISKNIIQYTKAGLSTDKIKQAITERYKDIEYDDSNFNMTGEVARQLLGNNNEKGATAIDTFLVGSEYNNAIETNIVEGYKKAIGNRAFTDEESKMVNERLYSTRLQLAKFRQSLARMSDSKLDVKPRMYYDKDLRSVIITDGEDRIALPKIIDVDGRDITNSTITNGVREYLKGTPIGRKEEYTALQML